MDISIWINSNYGSIIYSITHALISYILTGFAFMNLSKLRKMDKPWLAWIPIVNLYLIGSVTDNIKAQYLLKSNKKMSLLILGIITFVLGAVLYIFIVPTNTMLDQISDYYEMRDFYNANKVKLALLLPLSIIWLIIYTVKTVYLLQAYYTIFKEYSPSRAKLFIVLSIFIPFIEPIFVLLIMKNVPQFTLLNTRSTYNHNQYVEYQSNQQPQQPYQQPPQPPSPTQQEEENAPPAQDTNKENEKDQEN